MKVDIIAIGNSRGIRIPKPLLAQCGFGSSADIALVNGELVIRPISAQRIGWDETFRKMARNRDDKLLETPTPTFDEAEWKW